MRLFIAILLPDAIRDNIEASSVIVKKHSVKGSFPRKENYHITLAFLGEVEEDRIPAIRFAMEQCKVDSFTVSIEEIGSFRKNDGEIVHRIVDSTQRLYNLQDKLARLLRKSGFDLEKRKFTPHITIARRLKWQKDISLEDLLELQQMMDLEGAEFQACGMDLMLSEHVSGGQKYTSLYHVDFNSEEVIAAMKEAKR